MAEDGLILGTKDDALGNLLLMVGFGEGVRFAHSKQTWLIWDGVRWRPDRTRRIYERVREYVSKAWPDEDGKLPPDENGIQQVVQHPGEVRKALLSLYDTGRKESVLKGLSARPQIAMVGDEWDLDPYLLGFNNGILDLRTRTFDAHPKPTTLVSKSVGCDWDPDAKAPVFSAFLEEILGHDPDLVLYVAMMLGYSLFGLQSEQKFWMWVGRGANGKGALARTLDKALGDYAYAPDLTMYLRSKFGPARSDGARPDLLKLQGVRFAYMDEPDGSGGAGAGQFNEAMLKAHTGEATIVARDLYARKDQVAEWAPTHKIVFLTNNMPKTDDTGVSMRRRARVVKFEQDYQGFPDFKMPPDDDGNPTESIPSKLLEQRMEAEKQGIIAVLTRFSLMWWNGGDPVLPEPAIVLQWSGEYIEENDPLAKFVEECCVVGPQERGPAYALWHAYEEWAAGRADEPMSQTGFGNNLGRRFLKKRGSSGFVYQGIRAKSAVEIADEAGGDDD